jgi:dienelactone hydrolase
MFSRSQCPSTVQNYFAERGWLVLFPQRRGRGKSGGEYAEGLAADGTGYSCETEVAMRGFDRAVEDLDAVMAHVKTRDDVDFNRLAIGGVSRGGILSIAYAGMRPGEFRGAINFNGGWLGRGCPTYEEINPPIFRRGAAAGISTLWLHGTKDQYYPISHCRSNFDGYVAAGGEGSFVAVPGGHGLIFKPQLWKDTLDRYMERIERSL